MLENERLLPLAGAVADGRAVDWALAEAEAQGEEERTLVRHLRIVADVADVHRSVASVPVSFSDESDGETLAGPPDRKTSAEAPEAWGPLLLVDRVGRGTSADVWRAWDTRLDRLVALKLYRGSAPSESAVVEEGRLLARVRHPNVVTVHGAERIQGQAGLWMEFIVGRTLADLVTGQGPFGPREAALIGLDVCRALAATHRSGLVHGDVKANNVMREEGGRIVLMDLSAAKEAFDRREAGSLSGTPLYMAPELLRGGSATFRSDIYSLGVLLYHLVTASFPVRGKSLADLAQAHDRGERRLLRDARPDLPEAFIRVVERALAPDPAERFESAGSMEAELAQSLGAPAAATRSFLTRRLSLNLRVGLAACISLAAAAWLLRPPAQSAPSGRVVRSATTEGSLPVSKQTAARGPAPVPERTTTARLESEATSRGTAQQGSAVARAEPSTTGTPSKLGGVPASAPYAVQAAFHRHEQGADVDLLPGARVAPGDRLFLEFQASSSVYLYVVNEDERGAAFLLFPLPGQGLSNPLPADTLHRLPGLRDGQPVYWQVTSRGGRERFLLVANPEPLPEVEAEVAALEQPSFGQTILASPLETGVVERLRGLGGLAAGGSRTAGEPGRLERLALRLASRPETIQGAWIRQFDLEN